MGVWILLGLVGLIGLGTLAYAYFDGLKRKRGAIDEAVKHFRPLLVRELRSTKLVGFSLSVFAEYCDVPYQDAKRIGWEFFKSFVDKVYEDDLVTDKERQQLDKLAIALDIHPEDARTREQMVRTNRYREAVSLVLADGIVDAEESMKLVRLRNNLNISENEAVFAASDMAGAAYVNLIEQIVEDGALTSEHMKHLSRIKETLFEGYAEPLQAIRKKLLDVYARTVTRIVSDGEVTNEEIKLLNWFESETGLTKIDVEPYHQIIRNTREQYYKKLNHEREQQRRAQLLSQCREGRLPAVNTSYLLESGEICHYEDACGFSGNHPSYPNGTLLLTSRKLIFTSHEKGFETNYNKIIKISIAGPTIGIQSDSLLIKTSSGRGTGHYFVNDLEMMKVILTQLIKKSKFILDEGPVSRRSRHIPPSVRREVWARDGGRCVVCQSSDYLEFDHIIPHSKGGASTVENVQLLCRQCNNEKRDRI